MEFSVGNLEKLGEFYRILGKFEQIMVKFFEKFSQLLYIIVNFKN